jgi:hypothetical protein
MGGLQAIQLNNCKNFKNWVERIVNKRQIEFLKDEVIGHTVMEHPQNDKWLKLFGKTQILLE